MCASPSHSATGAHHQRLDLQSLLKPHETLETRIGTYCCDAGHHSDCVGTGSHFVPTVAHPCASVPEAVLLSFSVSHF
jgi:hypothetical protein